MKKEERKEGGQGLVEYLVIVALIAISSMGIISLLSHTLRHKLAQVTAALQGRKGPNQAELEGVSSKDWTLRDMGDFNSGAAQRK